MLITLLVLALCTIASFIVSCLTKKWSKRRYNEARQHQSENSQRMDILASNLQNVQIQNENQKAELTRIYDRVRRQDVSARSSIRSGPSGVTSAQGGTRPKVNSRRYAEPAVSHSPPAFKPSATGFPNNNFSKVLDDAVKSTTNAFAQVEAAFPPPSPIDDVIAAPNDFPPQEMRNFSVQENFNGAHRNVSPLENFNRAPLMAPGSFAGATRRGNRSH